MVPEGKKEKTCVEGRVSAGHRGSVGEFRAGTWHPGPRIDARGSFFSGGATGRGCPCLTERDGEAWSWPAPGLRECWPLSALSPHYASGLTFDPSFLGSCCRLCCGARALALHPSSCGSSCTASFFPLVWKIFHALSHGAVSSTRAGSRVLRKQQEFNTSVFIGQFLSGTPGVRKGKPCLCGRWTT